MFGADAEVGADLANVNWAATPLGAPSGWPLSLQTAVRILLRSRFSMWMAWGPELTFFCNAAYRRDTLGEKYPWALGRPANEVWAEIWDDIGPRIEKVLSTEEATWDEGLLLFLERSGYPEETYHTFSYSALSDDHGAVVGMLCVVSEDTDRVIGERRMTTLRDLGSDPSLLPSEEQTLRFAAERLGRNPRDLPFALIYLFTEDGGARLAASSGLPAGHPAAQPVIDVEATTSATSAVWPLDRALSGQRTVVALTGAPFTDLPSGVWPTPPAQALLVPLVQQGVAPYGFVVAGLNPYRALDEDYHGFVTLIAAHVAAEIGSARSYRTAQRRSAELAELDRAKTAFFTNISHEFRTPLTLMLGPVADILGTGDGIDEPTRHELEVVHRNGLRLTKLVNTLLDFTRIEADRMQAHYQPVDLAAVTAELASGFRSAVARAGLELVVDCPPLGEPVYLDRDMWEKVILNVLSNAVKFTFEGAITVALYREDADAVMTIADTGIGVPAAEVPRLFERFHRIPAARARSHEGSGIGLALVKELVGLHGGAISAASTEGVGTTFTIRLPFGAAHLPVDAVANAPASTVGPAPRIGIDPYLAEALRWLPGDGAPSTTDDDPVAAPDVGGAQTEITGAPARVLVADDNIDMRHYLARLLREAGYDVDEVGDGRQALDVIGIRTPDLVVSDVMMPVLDGLELLAALRSDPRTAAMPVLLLSARAGQEASIEALEYGADDYLVKPFAAADLLARVRAALTLARLRTHHVRWRTALIDSLQEAFFVCDADGTVIEINTAFTEVLGFGPEGVPYPAVHPWWPDADTDPEAHRHVADAFAGLLTREHGVYTVPVTHRNGHRLWVTFSFAHAQDPDTGRRVVVGTLRDVTAEHYRVRRQTALAQLTHALAQADTVDDALRTTADELRRLWGARRVLTVTFPSSPTVNGAPQVLGAGDPHLGWMELPSSTRTVIEALSHTNLLSPASTEPGSAGIAVAHPDGVLVIWIDLAEHRPFTAPDETLLTVLAGHLTQGLQRVHRVDQQRETAVALQHAILGPAALPSGFAVRYQPATQPLQVGGDWYDVIDLDDGRVGLIVGDCVGHGLTAATVMGQLRSACRALLLERPDPAAVLTGLDRFAARLPGARCTTAFAAVLDTSTGELLYSSAGHPPPILVHADGTTGTLKDGRAIPLGLRPGRPRPQATTVLPGRSTVLLYTDGLVERRRQSLDEGITRAADTLRDATRTHDLDALAGHLVTTMAPEDGYPDDVALLLYRQPAPLHLSFPAHAAQIATTRTALRTWLGRTELSPNQIQDLLVAAGEAVTNAVEHGHRDQPEGTITLTARTQGNDLHVSITDTGTWKPPVTGPDRTRGRGFTLMHALAHDVTIHSDDTGTTVDLHSRIP
ncbi:response regulator [Mycobacterium hodleri]|uniref:histidine kinase n=1 Tax=Mycolicibacterium hodleri TaxID=49897 RepID=A0A502DUY0_9MYCO|nr:response regulator [Mycolicibacterium hodleri]